VAEEADRMVVELFKKSCSIKGKYHNPHCFASSFHPGNRANAS